MRLILVRHGETIENKNNIIQGQSPGRLSELGREQSENLARRLRDEKIDLVYSSDLRRCKQSLRPLLKLRKFKVKYSKLLREMDKGVFNGRKRIYLDEWKKKNPGKLQKGGECWEDVRKRVAKFLNKNLKMWKGKNVLIMMHGGTKQILLKIFFENSFNYRKEIEEVSPNMGVTILSLSNKGDFVFDELYSIKHLENLK